MASLDDAHLTVYRYRRIYIPTGQVWDMELSCSNITIHDIYSVEAFHHLLIRWNGMNADKWAYAPI